MQWFKKHFITLLLVLIALAGVGLIAYPTFADWWNSFHQSRAVASYMEAVTDLDKEQYESILRSAEEYNEKLARKGFMWKLSEEEEKEYFKQLNVNDTGIMGYISIPKANVELPIYHGTDEAVLQIAIGHIEGTSLPVGGENTHCVVSGHRGLPSARLFTDLDKMVVGDTWTMNILDQTLTYEVDQIRVVLPSDLSELQIEEGKDLCTLITCTPYGINTHRLLVRGHRIPNANGTADITADGIQIEPIYIAPVLAVPAIILLLILLLISTRRAKRFNSDDFKKLYLEEKGLGK